MTIVMKGSVICVKRLSKVWQLIPMFAVGLMLCVVLLGFIGCSEGGGGDEEELLRVEFGAIFNMTGSQTDLGISSSRGAQLAIDYVNNGEMLLGGHVGFRVEDGESNPEVIAQKTAQMIKEYPAMTALFGLSDSDLALAAGAVAAKEKRVFLTSGATSPKLPLQIPTYLFLACFGDNVQAAAGAEWAWNDREYKKAIILFDSTEIYTTLLKGYFQTRFAELGGTILEMRPYDPKNIGQELVQNLPESDFVFLSAEVPKEALTIVTLLREAGLNVPVLGGDGYDTEDIWKTHPEVSNVFFTTHVYLGADNPDTAVQSFRAAYIEKWPDSEPDAFAALAYDSALLLVEAVRHCKSSEPEPMLKSLADMADFHGVTGTISYRNGNRIPQKSVTIIEIEEGKYKLVRQVMPSSIPAP